MAMTNIEKDEKKNKFVDMVLAGDAWINLILLFLVIVSLVEVYSSLNSGYKLFKDYDAQLKSHALKLFAGVGLSVVFRHVDVRNHKVEVFLGMFGMWVILILASLLGSSVNGASRYFMGIQPSEFIKVFLVCFLAFWISEQYKENGIVWHKKGFMIVVCLLIILPVMRENTSNGLLIGAVWISMLLLAGMKIRYVLGGIVFVVVFAGSVCQLTNKLVLEHPDANVRKERMESVNRVLPRLLTITSRMNSFLHSEELKDENLEWDKHFQEYHSKIAVANSEVIGKGPGNGQERQILPQAFSDFIFSIIVEELGIVGFVLVIGAYVFLILRAFQLAMYCDDVMSKFILFGCSLMIGYQALINISVGVSAMPVTGQPLPMVSRGGSSMFVTGVFFGIMQNVCKHLKEKSAAIEKGKKEKGLVRVSEGRES